MRAEQSDEAAAELSVHMGRRFYFTGRGRWSAAVTTGGEEHRIVTAQNVRGLADEPLTTTPPKPSPDPMTFAGPLHVLGLRVDVTHLERGEARILFDPVTETVDIVVARPVGRRDA